MAAPVCQFTADCQRPSNFGMTKEEGRYGIWLCEQHVIPWLKENGLELQEVLCGNISHTPALNTVPDEPTGEFPALPTPFAIDARE